MTSPLLKATVLIAASGMLLLLGACCEPLGTYEGQREGALIFDGFESYSSPREVLGRAARRSWDDIADERQQAYLDCAPPAVFTYGTMNEYTHLGENGKALFAFFNERLWLVHFYPEDLNAYLESLCEIQKLCLDSANSESAGPSVEAGLRRTADRMDSVYWVDRRLSKEKSRWIRKYAV